MKTLTLALSLCAVVFGQQCTGPAPAKPATPAGCSEMRQACNCDSEGSCQWAWSCMSWSKQVNAKAASTASSKRQPAPVSNSDSEQSQTVPAVQTPSPHSPAAQLSMVKPPVSGGPVEPAARLPKPTDQNAELIQLLQRIALATETIARELEQPKH